MTNLIWDFDGNLYDTYPIMMKAYEKALKDFNINLTADEIQKSYVYTKLHSFKELFAELEKNELIKTTATELSDRYHKYEKAMQQKPNFFENADKVLQTVVENNGKNFLLTHRDNMAIDFLAQDGLKKYFTDFVTEDNHFARKPSPESINYLVNKYNLPKDDTFMVGDRSLDLLAGINAGVKTIYFDIDHLDDNEYAVYSVNSLNEILKIIK